MPVRDYLLFVIAAVRLHFETDKVVVSCPLGRGALAETSPMPLLPPASTMSSLSFASGLSPYPDLACSLLLRLVLPRFRGQLRTWVEAHRYAGRLFGSTCGLALGTGGS